MVRDELVPVLCSLLSRRSSKVGNLTSKRCRRSENHITPPVAYPTLVLVVNKSRHVTSPSPFLSMVLQLYHCCIPYIPQDLRHLLPDKFVQGRLQDNNHSLELIRAHFILIFSLL